MKNNQVGFNSILFTYITFAILIFIGHVRDLFRKFFCPRQSRYYYPENGMPPIYSSLESFYYRRLYSRLLFACSNIVKGIPKKNIKLCQKKLIHDDNGPRYRFNKNKTKKFLNIGSYNYLGFATHKGEITEKIMGTIDQLDFNQSYFPYENGQNDLTRMLEREMAEFLHRDDCIVFPMGFGTNTWTISALFDENTLVLSDQYNHTSIIVGMKLSKANVVIFKHNDMDDLKNKLINHITQGCSETHRSWQRVFVVVEGIFSMEGTMPDLKKLLQLKQKYKFYIYIDEAHSCGAIGKTGRGVCEYQGIDHKNIDVLMGTFSKSFCANGGYVTGDQNLINYLRKHSSGSKYVERINPVIALQVLEALREIKQNRKRIKNLRKNTNYMRKKLKKLGFTILGAKASPVIPILIPSPGKLGKFYEFCNSMGLAIVIVGYPATSVLESRVRLCMSAAYRKKDLKRALKIINHAGTICGVKNNLKVS